MDMNTKEAVGIIEEVLEEYCLEQQNQFSYDDCDKHCLMYDKEKKRCCYNKIIDFISSIEE